MAQQPADHRRGVQRGRVPLPVSVAREGEQISFRDRDQDWVGVWHPPTLPAPTGTRWGSAAICFTPDREVVVVSSNGKDWEIPSGKPEGDEDWRATLDREMLEEACARVEEATLLGFMTGEIVRGSEKGLRLVRAHWRAVVSVEKWEPHHEISHRLLVPPENAMTYINMPQDRLPILQRWFDEAMAI